MAAGYEVLVLAGERGGREPVAAAAGVAHKSLARVGGVAMLERVVGALLEAEPAAPIAVCGASPDVMASLPRLVAEAAAGRLRAVPAGASPAASIRDHLAARGAGPPLLVTTADHALLTAEMVRHFVAAARREPAGLVVALVAASRFRARYPKAPRTFVPLAGDAYTGANLFWFASADAGAGAGFWTRMEALRKRPWRMAARLGPGAWLRFALRRLDLASALASVSRAMGVHVAAVVLPFAEAAIDVDRPEDLGIAEQVIAARRQSGSDPA